MNPELKKYLIRTTVVVLLYCAACALFAVYFN
jgi:preprotein translocase subunit SecE